MSNDVVNGKTTNDETVGGGPNGEVFSAEAFTMKTWAVDCPYCETMEDLGSEPSEGDEIVCMDCEKTFRIGSKRNNP